MPFAELLRLANRTGKDNGGAGKVSIATPFLLPRINVVKEQALKGLVSALRGYLLHLAGAKGSLLPYMHFRALQSSDLSSAVSTCQQALNFQ